MKDYAKLWGIIKCGSDSFITVLPFGEKAFSAFQFFYQSKELMAVEVELDDIYEKFGTAKYASIEDFAKDVAHSCYYFESKKNSNGKHVLCIEMTKNSYPGTYPSFNALKDFYQSICKLLSLDLKEMSFGVALDGARVADVSIKEKRSSKEKFTKILKFGSIGASGD